jgi:translation initiation factor eIF-2B subunit delta
MPAENTGAPTNGAPSDNAVPAVQDGAKNAPAPDSAAATTANTEKLTAAQLKAKAKAEKAARRAQVKEARAAVPAPSPVQEKGTAADAKGGKGKGRQDGQQPQGKGGHLQIPSVAGRRPSSPVLEKDVRSGIPDCFSHIPMSKRIPTSQAHKDVHPAVLAVGQQMATFALNDSISRLKATLLAFAKVCI